MAVIRIIGDIVVIWLGRLLIFVSIADSSHQTNAPSDPLEKWSRSSKSLHHFMYKLKAGGAYISLFKVHLGLVCAKRGFRAPPISLSTREESCIYSPSIGNRNPLYSIKENQFILFFSSRKMCRTKWKYIRLHKNQKTFPLSQSPPIAQMHP